MLSPDEYENTTGRKPRQPSPLKNDVDGNGASSTPKVVGLLIWGGEPLFAQLAEGSHETVAAALGFSAGAVHGYAFNLRWMFGARDSTRARARFVVVQAAGAASTSLLVLLFVRAGGVGKVAAYLAAIPPVTVAMYAANRLWTFADQGGRAGDPRAALRRR